MIVMHRSCTLSATIDMIYMNCVAEFVQRNGKIVTVDFVSFNLSLLRHAIHLTLSYPTTDAIKAYFMMGQSVSQISTLLSYIHWWQLRK